MEWLVVLTMSSAQSRRVHHTRGARLQYLTHDCRAVVLVVTENRKHVGHHISDWLTDYNTCTCHVEQSGVGEVKDDIDTFSELLLMMLLHRPRDISLHLLRVDAFLVTSHTHQHYHTHTHTHTVSQTQRERERERYVLGPSCIVTGVRENPNRLHCNRHRRALQRVDCNGLKWIVPSIRVSPNGDNCIVVTMVVTNQLLSYSLYGDWHHRRNSKRR